MLPRTDLSGLPCPKERKPLLIPEAARGSNATARQTTPRNAVL